MEARVAIKLLQALSPVNGNSATNRVLVFSGTLGTPRTITAANVSVTNADFRDITGAGAGNWNLSAVSGGSGDAGGNSGITFTTGQTQLLGRRWDTLSWSVMLSTVVRLLLPVVLTTPVHGRVPLPQDDASSRCWFWV
jgi:hypothetical protein